MTVGQPETNLDTWGLRYVKKKESPFAGNEAVTGKKDSKTSIGTTSDNNLSDLDISTPSHGGRQNDSSGDTVGRHAASGKKIGEQTHVHSQNRDRVGGQQRGTFTTSGQETTKLQGEKTGKKRHGHEGATAQIGSDESKRLGRDQTRMTSSGTKYDTRNQKRRLGVGEGAKHTVTSPDIEPTGTQGKRTEAAQTKRDTRSRETGATTTRGAGDKGSGSLAKPTANTILPKTAALNLAIIKCKLLKMNGLIKVEGFKITPKGEIGEKTDKKETPKAQEYTQEEKDKITNAETSKYPMYKSEDIVSKAVELINIAYDEMNKAEGGDSGTATTSTEGAFNHVYSDVHEKKKQEEKPCKHCGVGHKDGKSLGLSGEQEFHDRGHKNKPDAKRSGEL